MCNLQCNKRLCAVAMVTNVFHVHLGVMFIAIILSHDQNMTRTWCVCVIVPNKFLTSFSRDLSLSDFCRVFLLQASCSVDSRSVHSKSRFKLDQ